RDKLVTGVQTCALPIFEARGELGDLSEALVEEAAGLLGEPGRLGLGGQPSVILVVGVNGTGKTTTIGKLASRLREHGRSVVLGRSEERRVGKEGRSGWV